MKNSELYSLFDSIIRNDLEPVRGKLAETSSLACEPLSAGATRENPNYFVEELRHYIYAGDTALHVAAMAHRFEVLDLLVKHGARIDARNRRGAQPLHYACDGGPDIEIWNAEAQYKTVLKLIVLGADPDALDKSGVAPLHRAVRNRCTGAVRALIDAGANLNLKNKSGSTPLMLAKMTTGKSGSGSEEAKREQAVILELLKSVGAL